MTFSQRPPASAFVRRGECPTLQKPMLTGDGLLARLRPLDNRLSIAQLRAIAEAAAHFGNGIVEITARGSLQVRGLRAETVAAFEAAILATAIVVPQGVGVETPPLAGLDLDEAIDVRPLATALRTAIMRHEPGFVLAPKLAVTLDGGGRFHLGGVDVDVKASAFRDVDGVVRFRLMIPAGRAVRRGDGGARLVAVVDAAGVVGAVLRILEAIAELGPAARGRDLDLPTLEGGADERPPSPLAGLFSCRTGVPTQSPDDARSTVLGLVFAYCQARSDDLLAFCDAADAAGAGDIRLAPGHGLFVAGLSGEAAIGLRQTAAARGFITDPGDNRRAIALCAGSRGCVSGHYDTRALAEAIRRGAPDLIDGSFDLHLSGCAKGCAHPAPSLLTLVGAREGYGLVVNGAASDTPSAYIADSDIETALQRLNDWVRQKKISGESVADCLGRSGADAIADAVRLDWT
jgi:precorrin-3B synthase